MGGHRPLVGLLLEAIERGRLIGARSGAPVAVERTRPRPPLCKHSRRAIASAWHEKGGKRHHVPAHHVAEGDLNAHLDASGPGLLKQPPRKTPATVPW